MCLIADLAYPNSFKTEILLFAIAKTLSTINKDTPFTGVNMPLHIGAVKYYREVGVKIPKRLLPPEAK